MAGNIQEKIKDKIIDCINFGVAGRLIIFKPEKNVFGADLAVERRGKYKEGEMHFQINSFVVPAKNSNFIKDFSQQSFKANDNFYLLFVSFDEIGQKLSDHVWLIPSLSFRDMADSIGLSDGKSVLRFEAPTNASQENKYSKFLINTKQLGKLILEAFERGGQFSFKGDIGTENKINIETLKEFLCLARQNTYAAGTGFVDNPRLLESKQSEFQKGDYFYRDIYFDGDKKFIGQEVIYQNSKPVWGMNYMGSQIGKLETAFLKESLSKLAETCRIGQACEYEKRQLKYQDQGAGSLEEFSGKEEIFSQGKSIYKLIYQGGIISSFI